MATRFLIVYLLIVTIVTHSKCVQCIDIHIKSSSNDQCLGSPCLTLFQFSISALHRNETDITLILEPGNHRLLFGLRVAHMSSFSMIANTTIISNHSVIIDCRHRRAFVFTSVNTVFMEGLNFVHCLDSTVESVDDFTVVDSKFKGSIHSRYPGSLIKMIGYTSARFIRTSFEQNAFGTMLDSFEIGVFPPNMVQVGGAIYAQESKIEIVECLFKKNKVYLGGAIFIRNSSKITINRTLFIENTASYHNILQIHDKSDPGILQYLYGKAGGGALFADNSSVLIANSSFMHNEGENGGAVRYYSEHDDRIITIIESNFTNNVAYDGGGAISCNTPNTTIMITNCSFINNTALGKIVGNGGTLTFISAFNVHTTIRLQVSGNLFSNSTSKRSGGVISISRLNFHTSTIIMSHNYFMNNHADKKGGVLSFLRDPHANKSNDIILTKNLFENNSASEDGGVFEFKNTNVKVTKCNFTENRADGSGGIFTIVRSQAIIIQSSFQFNTAGKDGGVIMSELSNINISDSGFISNSVERNGHGGVITAERTLLTITETSLVDNQANLGGVLWTQQAVVEMYGTMASGNSANTDGGVFHTERSEIAIVKAIFIDNRADNNGGIMQTDRDRISMVDCEFNHSTAGNDGGVIRAYWSEVNASECVFISNRAEKDGGVYRIEQSNLTISNQTYFVDNTADTGGVIWNDAGVLKIEHTSLTNNKASMGGVIWTDAGTAEINTASFAGNKAVTAAVMWMDQAIIRGNRIKIHDNHANYTTIYSLESTIEFTSSSLSSNIGSLCAIESTIQLTDTVMTKMQTAVNQINMNRLKEGGAITAFQSDITFDGKGLLMHNRASQGGAICATEARLYVHGSLTVANNTAVKSGGGIYLYQSELICQRKSALMLLGNTVMEKGGGIYASGSLIKVKIPVTKLYKLKRSILSFMTNAADRGGGIFLEMDTKITILKSSFIVSEKHETIRFTANKANYGGAVYVSDDSMCALSASDNKYCSFQALALYESTPHDHYKIECNDNSCKNIYFDKNKARILGHSLYGGLFDRCKVSPLAEMLLSNGSEGHMLSNKSVITVGGLAYLRSISNVKNSDIGSPPIRVCFCRDGQPDCSYNPGPVPIRRGQLTEIPLSLAALDQINRPIEATIYNRLSSGDDLCQHHVQTNDGNCSIINFTASLNLNESQNEELTLLMNGPCKEIPSSQVRLTLTVYCPKCPIGFELVEDEEGCRCQCDKNLLPFISNCRPSSKALVRDRNIWIAYLNSTDDSEGYQYLKHPYCPLDYCHPSSSRVEINLNLPNGSDAQCANGHTGLLCGTCQPGLSLSLGSSHCIRCPPHWPVSLTAIIIAALLAGILLVVFIMLLNLTVAIGTLNAIVFYANILAVRNSTFLKFSNTNFAAVFISWLNLEVGIDACFFERMDAFWKTVLQLAFPTYIISLVIIVIIIGEHSSRFSNLIGKRNPVATLATLILLSYTKLLNTVITSLSFAVLHYPDGSQRTVWLADASVDYLRGKHVLLFIIAGIILIAGVFYTALLLFWPCLLRQQECFLLRWTKYPKLCHFIEPYHAPYTFKHRYWTGLLLLSRVLLHLVSAVNTTGDPRLTIVTISLIIASLLLTKGIVANKVYKNRLIDISETIVHFNLLVLASLTWYNLDANKSQAVVAYISVMITFALLSVVIAVHVYKYTSLFTNIKRFRLFKEILATMQATNDAKQQAKTNEYSKPSVAESGSKQNHPEGPTYSIVEVCSL